MFGSRLLTLALVPAFAALVLYYYTGIGDEANLHTGALLYEVASLPGKGKGLIATRNITRGELILREKPLFVLPSSIQTSPLALIASHLSSLTAKDRAKFLDLSYLPVQKNEDIPLSIFQTNAVAAGSGHVGMFPAFARLNHACAGSFNVVYSYREGQIYVFALKDIVKGAELLTTYFDTKRPRSDRQSYLAQNYGFQCDCSTCTLPASLSAKSDANLVKMSSLYSRMSLWSSDPAQLGTGGKEGIEAVDIARSIWILGNEEGYHSERGQLAADVVQICLAHSDVHAARQWAALAIRWFGFELGPDTHQIDELRKTIARPESSPWWGMRKVMRVPGTEGLED